MERRTERSRSSYYFVTQITSEHLTKRKLPNGATEDVWQVGDVEPHLGDTMKEPSPSA